MGGVGLVGRDQIGHIADDEELARPGIENGGGVNAAVSTANDERFRALALGQSLPDAFACVSKRSARKRAKPSCRRVGIMVRGLAFDGMSGKQAGQNRSARTTCTSDTMTMPIWRSSRA